MKKDSDVLQSNLTTMSGKCLWNRDRFPRALAWKVADFGVSLCSLGAAASPGVPLPWSHIICVSAGVLAPASHTSSKRESHPRGLEYLWKTSCMRHPASFSADGLTHKTPTKTRRSSLPPPLQCQMLCLIPIPATFSSKSWDSIPKGKEV